MSTQAIIDTAPTAAHPCTMQAQPRTECTQFDWQAVEDAIAKTPAPPEDDDAKEYTTRVSAFLRNEVATLSPDCPLRVRTIAARLLIFDALLTQPAHPTKYRPLQSITGLPIARLRWLASDVAAKLRAYGVDCASPHSARLHAFIAARVINRPHSRKTHPPRTIAARLLVLLDLLSPSAPPLQAIAARVGVSRAQLSKFALSLTDSLGIGAGWQRQGARATYSTRATEVHAGTWTHSDHWDRHLARRAQTERRFADNNLKASEDRRTGGAAKGYVRSRVLPEASQV